MAPKSPGEAMPNSGAPAEWITPDADPDDIVADTHQRAYRRRFALGHHHPDVTRTDPQTFWVIWRDGVAWAIESSAQLNPALRKAAELIVLLAQAHDAAPEVCPHCHGRLDQEF